MCHLCMTFTYIIHSKYYHYYHYYRSIITFILSKIGHSFLTTMYLKYAIIHPLHIQLFNLHTIFNIHFLFVIQFSFLYDISPLGYNARYHIATIPDYASEQLWVDL